MSPTCTLSSDSTTATQIAEVIAEHERHQGCYFWSPRAQASRRRAAEFDVRYTWIVAGETITVHQSHRESCKNVYYRFNVTVNGRRSNVTALRRALASLRAVAA